MQCSTVSNISNRCRNRPVRLGCTPRFGTNSRLQPLLANKGVDPSVKALEAAVAAINKMLSAHQALTAGRQGRKSPGADQQQPGAAGQARRPKGKGKVISFKAEASATRPVQEVFPCLAAAPAPAESLPPPDTPGGTTSSSASPSSTWPPTSAASPTPPPAAAAAAGQASAPDMARSLKAYLSLPLDQYSVLDPRYISVLPEDWNPATHVSSSGSSSSSTGGGASSSSSRDGGDAASAAVTSSSSSSADADHSPSGGSSSSSGSMDADRSRNTPSGTTGHAANIPMRPLDAPPASSSAVTAGAAEDSPGPPPSTSHTPSPGQPAPAPQSMPSVLLPPGCTAANFLLRVPLADVVGVDLTPELVFRVEADTSEGQVTFTTRYLKTGEPAVDKDLQMDIHAELDSQLLQAAALQTTPAAARTEVAVPTGSSSSSSSSNDPPASPSPVTAITPTPQQQQQQEQDHQQQEARAPPPPAKWQQQSQLRSHVSLKMRLMVGYPLSIVPGPMLSATASLVAQLTMKALLPSFLDLLGTDYARWASGTSTSSRQALPAGDLLRPAGASSSSSSSPVSGSYSATAGGESSSSSVEDGAVEADDSSSSSSAGSGAATVAATSVKAAPGS